MVEPGEIENIHAGKSPMPKHLYMGGDCNVEGHSKEKGAIRYNTTGRCALCVKADQDGSARMVKKADLAMKKKALDKYEQQQGTSTEFDVDNWYE